MGSLGHQSHSGRAYDGSGSMERPLVTMTAKMIRCKASVPHDIIQAEMGATPIVVEALTRAMAFIHSLWRLPHQRYARLALESSRQLASSGDISCWFAQISTWFELHGFQMDRLPPFQYSLDSSPSLTLSRTEIGRIIRHDLTQLHSRQTCITPPQELQMKMAFYKEHMLQMMAL